VREMSPFPYSGQSRAGPLRNVMMATFRQWDSNGDGFLSQADLGGILNKPVSLGNFDMCKHGYINYKELVDFLYGSDAGISNELLRKIPLQCLQCSDGHPMSEFAPALQGWCCNECSHDLPPNQTAWQCMECSGLTWCAQCSLRLFTQAEDLYCKESIAALVDCQGQLEGRGRENEQKQGRSYARRPEHDKLYGAEEFRRTRPDPHRAHLQYHELAKDPSDDQHDVIKHLVPQEAHDTSSSEDELPQLLLAERCILDLQKLRVRAIEVLGFRTTVPRDGDLFAYLRALESEVCNLEAEADACRQAVFDSACYASSVWKELDEGPESGDAAVVDVVSTGHASSAVVSQEVVAKVNATKLRWDLRRMTVEAEVADLHASLHSFGGANVAEFLILHGSLSKSDRAACRKELQALLTKQRSLEQPALERIRHLYDSTGVAQASLESFSASLETAATLEQRQSWLSKEEARMETYFESAREILKQVEEIKDLLTKAKHFELTAHTGERRFSGNCSHFLEQDKFRKRFARRFPALRDNLLFDLALWEVEAGASFVYHGQSLRERLFALQEAELVELVPGDLGRADKLLQLVIEPCDASAIEMP